LISTNISDTARIFPEIMGKQSRSILRRPATKNVHLDSTYAQRVEERGPEQLFTSPTRSALPDQATPFNRNSITSGMNFNQYILLV
jgi:hypothetical protein